MVTADGAPGGVGADGTPRGVFPKPRVRSRPRGRLLRSGSALGLEGRHAGGRISPDPRARSVVGTITRCGSLSSPSSRANTRSAASRPISYGS